MPSLLRNSGVGGSTTNVVGLNCTTALTVALWARVGGSGASGDVIRHASTANNARDGFRVVFRNTEFGIDILGATGSQNYVTISGSKHRDGLWHHFTGTYDSTNDQMRGYLDGRLVNVTVAAQNISANASTTTTWNPGVVGSGEGFMIFDLQILPDVVVPPQDVPLLMNPKHKYPNVKGRYFGIEFRTTAPGTGACRDESGNGNHLTISPNTVQAVQEPPYLPTYQ